MIFIYSMCQGSKGIRQWSINWCTNPNDDKQIYPLCRLKLIKLINTQLNEPTNQNQMSRKLLSQRIRKRYYKTLGTSVANFLFFLLSISSICYSNFDSLNSQRANAHHMLTLEGLAFRDSRIIKIFFLNYEFVI